MTMFKHKQNCWCYEQEYPYIYNTGMNDKSSSLIHFTCEKCNAHVIVSRKQPPKSPLCSYCRGSIYSQDTKMWVMKDE